MTNGRGDRARDTPYRHRDIEHVGMIGARASRTSSGPAAHATAAQTGRIHDRSQDPRPHNIKALANRGPSIHDNVESLHRHSYRVGKTLGKSAMPHPTTDIAMQI